MRTIIAGSRSCTDEQELTTALADCGWQVSEVVSGAASGADALGEAWARQSGIPCKQFPADWSKFGKSAGPRRNVEMANYADALIALWDGSSKGTKHMIDTAQRERLRMHVHIIGVKNGE